LVGIPSSFFNPKNQNPIPPVWYLPKEIKNKFEKLIYKEAEISMF